LLENYGHAGIKFTEHLLQFSDEEIIESFKKCKDIVKSRMRVIDSFSDRIADKIAVVDLAARLAKQSL